MRTNRNKVLIIVLIIIAILAISGGVFAYLYLATDMFRTGQELFAKYLTQDIEEISQTLSFNKLKELEAKLEQNKYEENITLSYTEEGAEEALGQLAIDTQNDSINKKYYGNITLDLADGEEALQVEYMKEDDIYALRFTNAVKQFLSIQNSNLKDLATNLGLDEESIEQIPDTINFEEQNQKLEKAKLTEEEKNAEIKKYSELLYTSIAKEKYSKSKNTVITVNGKTITTNAYVLKLSEQDIQNVLIKLLETLKQDEIILAKLQSVDEITEQLSEESIKDSYVQNIEDAIEALKQEEVSQEENILITVYEENGKTVRLKLEQGLEYITLDTAEAEGKKQIDMNYTSIDEDNTQISNGITLIKESDNKLSIELKSIEGEEQQNIKVNITLTENGNNAKLDIEADIVVGQILFTRDINILEEIDYEVTLDNSNNIILNDLTAEQISSIFTLVAEKINSEYVERFNVASVDTELDATEIETFNSNFTNYEGTNVSTDEVNMLLAVVVAHNIKEANELTERYVTVTGDIILDAEDVAVAKLEGDKHYTVVCQTENELVNEIVITEN